MKNPHYGNKVIEWRRPGSDTEGVGESLNLNNEHISEVKDLDANPTTHVTPPPTRVEEVEHINRIATSKEVRFEVANQVVKKLKRNWGRKVAKQQHQECNETSLKVTKQKVKSIKYAKRQQK